MDGGREQWMLDSWEWLKEAARLPAKTIAAPAGQAAALVASGRYIVTGGWFSNTSATAGHVSVFDSVDGTGLEVARFALPSSGIANITFPGRGALLDIGCYVSVSQGTLLGAMYLLPLWHYPNTAPGH